MIKRYAFRSLNILDGQRLRDGRFCRCPRSPSCHQRQPRSGRLRDARWVHMHSGTLFMHCNILTPTSSRASMNILQASVKPLPGTGWIMFTRQICALSSRDTCRRTGNTTPTSPTKMPPNQCVVSNVHPKLCMLNFAPLSFERARRSRRWRRTRSRLGWIT